MENELRSMCKPRLWPNVSFWHSPEVTEESRDDTEDIMSCLLVEMRVEDLQITKDGAAICNAMWVRQLCVN
jgi:hypothetical protein